MTERIRVHVVQYRNCANLTLRYTDPRTGKHRRKSAKTANPKEARDAAAVWADQLNSGKCQPTGNLSWAEFRIRYENEAVSAMANGTAEKIASVLNVMEAALPVVAKGKLRDLTAARVSTLQTALRDGGRSESTIAGHLGHLRAALSWAFDLGMIAEIPKFKRPKRAKKAGGSCPMKGRPISGEEFERLLSKTAGVVGEKAAPEWERLLRGLWTSGLRLGEALNLSWDDPRKIRVDLAGRRPMLCIPGELQKNGKDEVYPVAPEFAELLLATPEQDRKGPVFRPRSKTGAVLGVVLVSAAICRIGKAANVVVNRGVRWVSERANDPATGKPTGEKRRVRKETPKYASAHDLRRSFGERWAGRLMPKDLMLLMRHASIDTTLRFYVGRNAQTTAEAVWAAHKQNQQSGSGTILGTVDPTGEPADVKPLAESVGHDAT